MIPHFGPQPQCAECGHPWTIFSTRYMTPLGRKVFGPPQPTEVECQNGHRFEAKEIVHRSDGEDTIELGARLEGSWA